MIYHYDWNTHNVTFWIFSCRTLNNFYQLLVIIVICNEEQTNYHISNIMRKCHSIFIENVTIWKWHKCNIYIRTTIDLAFKQLHLFYPMKLYIYLKQFHIWHRLFIPQVIYNYTCCISLRFFLQKSTAYKRNHYFIIKSLAF